MAGEWLAWALPDVSKDALRSALETKGLVWDDCLHVTATGSLAKAMRVASSPAISIAALLDAVAWAGMPADWAMEIDRLPSLSSVVDGGRVLFEAELKSWSNELAGRNLRLGISADLRLRRFLDREAPDVEAGQVLRRSVRDLRRAVQAAAAAGFEPDDFVAADTVTKVAVEAWKGLASDVPDLFRMSDDLWTDPSTFAEGSTPDAVRLRRRIDAVLARLLGGSATQRTIVYHGFYFFTPHQWAWFQLLRRHGAVDQHFVVHDDGTGRAFETWRRYFVDRWEMPKPQPIPGTATPVTSRASLLSAALTGAPVPTSTPESPVRLVQCSSSTEFINLWRLQRSTAQGAGRPKPSLFAAGASDIDRFVQRLDYNPAAGDVNLAELPIGQFLLALHGCVETLPSGGYRLVLDRSRLMDMVASRLLDTGDVARDPSLHLAAFERAIPFFDDCSLLTEWVARATVLERLIISEVSAFGSRTSGLSDRQRISAAASNPLRLVPWADLSQVEAVVFRETLDRITDMAQRVTSAEELQNPDKYLGWIRQQLERGMANLPADESKVIEDKLRGVEMAGAGDLDVEGIIDVVQMLLGRQAEFGMDGDFESDSMAARELRNLDALGFVPSEADVHVANLVDTEFPARHQSFRWPFTERLLNLGDRTSRISVEIFRTREETAALSDLYLFWLALSGVAPSADLTLSWITELGTDIRNPSSLLMLIAALDHESDVLKESIGGLPVERAGQMMNYPPDRHLPTTRPPEHTETELVAAVAKLDPIAASSAFACPRRFAIQWAMGPSAAFQTAHTQRMLYGNVQDALQKNQAWALGPQPAVRLTKDLWRQFTRGERMSSYVKRVVKTTRSAYWQWIYSLGGMRSADDPMSQAYRAAIARALPPADVIAPPTGVLPGPVAVTERVCNMCPVKPRCALQEFGQR